MFEAFQTTKDNMRIEFKTNEVALLHFPDEDRAMKAYYAYLQSTSSLGTVNPYDPQDGSSPKSSAPTLRKNRSFQSRDVAKFGMSTINSWRSSDKLNTLGEKPKLGHKSNSSRSSIMVPSLGSTSKASSPGETPTPPRLGEDVTSDIPHEVKRKEKA